MYIGRYQRWIATLITSPNIFPTNLKVDMYLFVAHKKVKHALRLVWFPNRPLLWALHSHANVQVEIKRGEWDSCIMPSLQRLYVNNELCEPDHMIDVTNVIKSREKIRQLRRKKLQTKHNVRLISEWFLACNFPRDLLVSDSKFILARSFLSCSFNPDYY